LGPAVGCAPGGGPLDSGAGVAGGVATAGGVAGADVTSGVGGACTVAACVGDAAGAAGVCTVPDVCTALGATGVRAPGRIGEGGMVGGIGSVTAGGWAGVPVGPGFLKYRSPTTYPTIREITNKPISVRLRKKVFCRTIGLFGA
jgi:hypothetical protein